MKSASTLMRAIKNFTLLIGGIFLLLLIIIIGSMIESYLSGDIVSFQDNLPLMILFLIVASFFSSAYMFFGLRLKNSKKLSKTLFITMEIVFIIFAFVSILFGIIFGFTVPSDFTPNALSIILVFIGVVHLVLFFTLLLPNIKNKILQNVKKAGRP